MRLFSESRKFTQRSLTVVLLSWAIVLMWGSRVLMSDLKSSQLALLYKNMVRGFWRFLTGHMSSSAFTASWSEIPGITSTLWILLGTLVAIINWFHNIPHVFNTLQHWHYKAYCNDTIWMKVALNQGELVEITQKVVFCKFFIQLKLVIPPPLYCQPHLLPETFSARIGCD